VLDYYRLTADGRLLFGGGANYSGKDSRDIAAELRPCIEQTFPALKGVAIDYQWSCAMGIVINRIPQLGKLSDNVWYCQGYSGTASPRRTSWAKSWAGRSPGRWSTSIRSPLPAHPRADGRPARQPDAGSRHVVLPDARKVAVIALALSRAGSLLHFGMRSL
jgi:hypothetical protein